jgi:hypothetical protein
LEPLPTVPFLPASQVSISIGQHTITHHIPTQLRTFAGLPGLRAQFVKHHEWETPGIFDIVNWPMFHATTLATSFLKRLSVIKWINDLLPFLRQQYLYKQSPSASCLPACGCSNEDWAHFPRCQHVQHKQSWMTFVSSLCDIMERWSLYPGLRRILLHITAPLSTLPPIPLTHNSRMNIKCFSPLNAPSAPTLSCSDFSATIGFNCKTGIYGLEDCRACSKRRRGQSVP